MKRWLLAAARGAALATLALGFLVSPASAKCTPNSDGSQTCTSTAAYSHAGAEQAVDDTSHGLPVQILGAAGTDTKTTGLSLALQTLNATQSIAINGVATVSISVTNITGSAATLTIEVTGADGTNWKTKTCNTTAASTITADGNFRCNTAGDTQIRVRVSTAGATQNATVAFDSSSRNTNDVTETNSAAILSALGNGIGTPGSAAPAQALYQGGRAATADPTAVTDGQLVAPQYTKTGRTVTAPYSITEGFLYGTGNTTGNTATNFTGMGAQGASVKIYIVSVQCWREDTATTALHVTLNDSASTPIPVPPTTLGAAIIFPIPLQIAANAQATFTPSASITTTYCNAQGYKGL